MTYFFLLVYCTTTTQCYRWMTFERFVKCAVKEVPFSWLLGRENKQSLGSSLRTFSHFFSPFLFWRKIEAGCSLRTIANQPQFSSYFLKPTKN